MNEHLLSAETTVAQALEISTNVAPRLMARRTACVGCYLSRFCTLRDTARYYRFPLIPFIDELRQATSDIIVSQGGPHA
jgi:hypothetical protein